MRQLDERLIKIVPSDRQVIKGTTVGYKKIARFPQIESDALIVQILDSRMQPTLSFIGIYE